MKKKDVRAGEMGASENTYIKIVFLKRGVWKNLLRIAKPIPREPYKWKPEMQALIREGLWRTAGNNYFHGWTCSVFFVQGSINSEAKNSNFVLSFSMQQPGVGTLVAFNSAVPEKTYSYPLLKKTKPRTIFLIIYCRLFWKLKYIARLFPSAEYSLHVRM